ncbi:MAG TPA: 3-hydroxyacyl-CoA dehydrogenase family protein [Alphaproteobacteria bacterium]|nr:3-hydroxyacyl-CoA dehydrogenase family protein [Alphaproteobacteria bacterium]
MAVPRSLNTVAVIGNGIIGHGVAQVFAMSGKRVRLIGRSADSLKRAKALISEGLALFRENGLIAESDAEAALARVEISTRLEDARDAQLVVEAVPENMELKRGIFGRLDSICPPPAVLASSSGHPASELVERVGRPERVIAAHFWYPPQLLPLVEVCGGPATAPEVVTWTCEVLREAGKEPVVIDREVPGFIGNRIQFAALREAWALWASGVASAEAIDAVVRNSIGRRLGVTGPIESADLGGLETMYNFARFLQPTLDVAPEPPGVIGELVRQGRKSIGQGGGIYDWTKRDGEALLAVRRAELIRWLKADRDRRSRQR